MNFELSPEHQAIRDLARRFAQEEIRPVIEEYEREGRFPRDLYRRMGELGSFGCTFPAKYGGNETGFLSLILFAEEVARAYFALSAGFNMLSMTVPFTILNWGTEAQREKYIPPLIRGEWLGFFGLTESGGGTDVLGAMRTRAVRTGDSYVLNGSKTFITFGTVADVGLVFAYTDPAQGAKGVTAFIVESGTPGFSARPMSTSALGKLMATSELVFQDCRVPEENRLGAEGEGFKIAMNAVDHGRLTIAARAVGLAQGCLDLMLDYARQRQAFGQPIGRFQMIQRLIADTVADVEAARLLVYRAAWLFDRGLTPNRETYIAKYFAGEAAWRASQALAEIYGGYAFADELPIARMVMAAQLFRTGEGSANLQRILIAEDALGWRPADRHALRRRFRLASDLT